MRQVNTLKRGKSAGRRLQSIHSSLIQYTFIVQELDQISCIPRVSSMLLMWSSCAAPSRVNQTSSIKKVIGVPEEWDNFFSRQGKLPVGIGNRLRDHARPTGPSLGAPATPANPSFSSTRPVFSPASRPPQSAQSLPNMVQVTFDPGALDELNSVETRSLFDTTNKLSSLGIGRIVNLPRIIVVGDQSSGKSSVLEAISHVKFPVGSDLCTRFATELVLRNGSQ